jgi:hypothetical protein
LVAATSFWLSDGSIIPIQLFNFMGAAAALGGLTLIGREPRRAAILAAIVGGTFFAGFIYLFHLHGAFYSPVLILIVFLLWIFTEGPIGSVRTDLLASLGALVGFLFHPYALFLFAGGFMGFWTKRLMISKERPAMYLWLLGALLLIGSLVLVILTKPSTYEPLSSTNVAGFLSSYRAAEIHPALSVLAAVLTVIALVDLPLKRRGAMAAVAIALSAAFMAAGLPVLMLWAAACILRTVLRRNWPLSGLIAVALWLPAISPTGSPTYTLFVIMGCIAATSFDSRLFAILDEVDLSSSRILAMLSVVAVLAVALRLGVPVPLVSRFARPLLSEREKTHQLEELLEWWETSPYRTHSLRLYRNSENPVDSSLSLSARRFRPPTYQSYLNVYTAGRGEGSPGNAELLVTFGDDEIPGATPMRTIEGRYAGAAHVYMTRPVGAQ